MKNVSLCFLVLLLSISANGQDIGRPDKSIPSDSDRYQNAQDLSASFFTPQHPSVMEYGHFKPKHFSLPAEMGPDAELQKPLDILAISASEERFKQAHRYHSSVPERQIKQINANSKVFHNRRSSWNRANDNLHFYGKNTPDGGIKNEAIEDIRQPFIDPYYQGFTPGYRSYHPTNSPRGFYFYRR